MREIAQGNGLLACLLACFFFFFFFFPLYIHNQVLLFSGIIPVYTRQKQLINVSARAGIYKYLDDRFAKWRVGSAGEQNPSNYTRIYPLRLTRGLHGGKRFARSKFFAHGEGFFSLLGPIKIQADTVCTVSANE